MKQAGNQFYQSAPDRLEMKKGGGCIGCFGIPFFAAGIFILLMGLQIIPVSNASEMPWWSWIIVLLMGLVFTGVGATLVFGRGWISINTTQRRVWLAWGLLRPMRGKIYDLDAYRKICLSFVAGDSDTADSYTLALKSNTGGELALCSFQDYGKAHSQGELLMSFLKLPLEDLSSDHARIISPDSPRLEEIKTEVPNPPAELKCHIQSTPNGLELSLPGPAFKPVMLLELLIPLLIVLIYGSKVMHFFSSSHTPAAVSNVFLGFFFLMFIFIPLISTTKRYLASKRYSYTLYVDAKGISLLRKGQGKKGRIELSRNQIIALDYGTTDSGFKRSLEATATNSLERKMPVSHNIPDWVYKLQRFSRAKGVIIKSQVGVFYFGAGLPDEEVYYLYSLIREQLQFNLKQS